MRTVILALLSTLPIWTFAQDSIPRVPIVEVFTSSTCGPCRPGNEGLKKAYVDDATINHRYTIIKYQMSWPGLGDPYFTSEASGRRNIYGVNGVPHLYINGQVHFQPLSSTTSSELEKEMKRFSYMKITPHVKTSNGGKTFDIDVTFKALQEIKAPASRLYVAIIETETVKNKKSNGESEFEMVFKKMLPNSGQLVIGDLAKDTSFTFKTTYTFNGSYRLPNSSRDPIDHLKEHSVEDFSNLKVVVWIQSLQTKEIYNSAWGFDPDDKTHPNHPQNPSNPLGENFNGGGNTSINNSLDVAPSVSVYPNPSQGLVNVQLSEGFGSAKVEIIDAKGAQVDLKMVNSNESKEVIPFTIAKSGIYIVRVTTENSVLTKKVVVD